MTTPFSLPVHMQREFFDPVSELGEMRSREPVARVKTPWGTDAWLVTRFEDAMSVLGDDETFEVDPASIGLSEIMVGDHETIDGEDRRLTHAQVRRLLQPTFTARRINHLSPAIERHVEHHLDLLADADRPADFVKLVGKPVPLLVLCELLGIDPRDRAEFLRLNGFRLDNSTDPATQFAAAAQCRAHISTLVSEQRNNPGDGVIGTLVREHGERLDDALITGLVDLLLLAGYESVASMLGIGVLLLLENPDKLPTVLDDSTVADAMEEMLRYLSTGHVTLPRTVRKPATLGDAEMAIGDVVLCSVPAANRDPDFVADPDQLDLLRKHNAHIAFGYGVHRCFGAPLARVQMRACYQQLFRRFPTLRVAVAREDIPFQTAMTAYGVAELPVTW